MPFTASGVKKPFTSENVGIGQVCIVWLSWPHSIVGWVRRDHDWFAVCLQSTSHWQSTSDIRSCSPLAPADAVQPDFPLSPVTQTNFDVTKDRLHYQVTVNKATVDIRLCLRCCLLVIHFQLQRITYCRHFSMANMSKYDVIHKTASR